MDHLFLDQDAIPTLVEVKRSSDIRIRGEVIGQMLDYTANAVAYWPVETIRAMFEATCTLDGVDAEERLGTFSQTDPIPNSSGKQRRRICRPAEYGWSLWRMPYCPSFDDGFLNGQMDPAEVLAVEVQACLAWPPATEPRSSAAETPCRASYWRLRAERVIATADVACR